MLKEVIEKALNHQIVLEAQSSQFYLSMASWAETQGLNGTAEFLYEHSDEERMHMLKLVRFVNERGGHAIVPALTKPQEDFESLEDIFTKLLDHEIFVSEEINGLVHICLQNQDYTTHNFLQWFVSEQIEEEALARTVMDKIKMIGADKGGLYLFDRDIIKLSQENSNDQGMA